MFPGNDIVSSLIAVQMGGTGGGGVTSDMLDVFEQQTPIIDIPLFGDYRFSLVKLPEGYYYPIQRSYQETTNGSEKVFYENQRYYHTALAMGFWQGETLLYVDSIVFDFWDYKSESWNINHETNTPYLSNRTAVDTPDIKETSVSIGGTNAKVNITIKYTIQQHQTAYNESGEITGQYDNEYSRTIYPQLGADNWCYTRFKGNELMNKIDEVAHDIYAEYLKNQG